MLFLKELLHRFLGRLTRSSLTDLEWAMYPALGQPDMIMDLRLPRRLAVQGAKVNFLISSNHQRRRLRLSIPPGVKDGSWLRIKGGGKNAGGQRGHLFINIHIQD
ncbi:MAG: DnaJ C-terminal domain-containing protein [Desulfobaccales bacterium]